MGDGYRIGAWRKREWAPWLRGNAQRCVHSSDGAGSVRWSSDWALMRRSSFVKNFAKSIPASPDAFAWHRNCPVVGSAPANHHETLALAFACACALASASACALAFACALASASACAFAFICAFSCAFTLGLTYRETLYSTPMICRNRPSSASSTKSI